jgi:amino acid adenylation domain-containing protein
MEKFIQEPRFVAVDFDPFTGPAIERAIPTTEAQREVLTASEMGVDASCAYNESVSLELKGTLDRAALQQAMHELVKRHESLRATLNASGTRMLVTGEVRIELPFTDLSSLSDAERTRLLDAIAEKDMTTPFDLRNGPLFRAQLIQVASDVHLLRLSGHHVVCDGWSLGIMMAEISALYNAAKNGGAPKLPEASTFSEYSLATIDFAKSPDHAAVERYWLDLYKGSIPRLDLPTDRPRPKQKTYKGHRLDLLLSQDLVRGLKEVATRSGASFVTTLMTTFEVLLHKLTGDSDIVVGLPAAGQSDLGMKHLVGHCVNLLALRSRIDEERPFIEHLKARRTGVLDAFDNQKYTFGTLLRKLNVPREPGRIPLCPVVFNIDMNMDDGVGFDGLQHRFISNPRAFENFELFLNATGSEGQLTLEWSYNTDLFEQATVRGWMDQLVSLVQRVIAHPEAPIAELAGDQPLGSERQSVPTEWQGLAVPYPKEKGVNMLFDEVVAQHGTRVALVHGDRTLTYAELRDRVLALTAVLKERGVRPGDLVALCCERNFSMVEAQLAILRAGAAFIPLDHTYPADRLRMLIEDTRPKLLLVEASLEAALPAHQVPVMHLGASIGKPPASTDLTPLEGPETAAYIMFTSGSTGKPKGVVVPHRGIVRLVREQNYAPFGPDAVITQLSNVSFDASTFELWGALLNGGKLVLQPQAKPTLAEVTETIERHGVNIMFITTGLFNVLVDEHVERLKGLKCILTGGEVMSLPHIRKALQVLGPGVLNNIYGPTENTTFSCFHPVNSEDDIGRQVPIGKPIHNTFLHVLDEQLRPVPVGAKGELYCGGDGVALGYWDRPDLTAERFLPDPFRGGDARMYRSGDLVRWLPDGSLEFMGRADDQVKVRGFRIELGEIENAISAVPGVRDRLVMVRRDMPGDQQLVAYVVPKDFDPNTDHDRRDALLSAVRKHLEGALPKFMLPAFYVALPAFPLNPNGKVDKKLLPAPELRSTRMRAQHVSPRNAEEAALAELWAKALGVPDIGIHDDFFDLGGHSIMGIQLLTHIEQRFDKALPLKALFEAPTIAQFAELLRTDSASQAWKNLSLVQPGGDGIPLFIVHGDEASHFIPKHLGAQRPFYAFFHQGEDGKEIRYTSVESIARHFISELKQARPHGPYLLCGYSFGGIVAYEMAQQLTAMGDEVPYLAVLDTYSPALHGKAIASDMKFYDPLKKSLMRGLVSRFLRNGGTVPTRLRNFHIIDTYDRAAMNYTPRPYKGKLTVFKAEHSWGPNEMGWESLAKGGMEVRIVPGDHYTVIEEPNVGQLAKDIGGQLKTLENVMEVVTA